MDIGDDPHIYWSILMFRDTMTLSLIRNALPLRVPSLSANSIMYTVASYPKLNPITKPLKYLIS